VAIAARNIRRCNKPVIAKINGAASGAEVRWPLPVTSGWAIQN
jgi:1,4-dihydroxy-2-naphthoyl-CoA synthase